MSDFETHPIGTLKKIEDLEALVRYWRSYVNKERLQQWEEADARAQTSKDRKENV